MDTKVVGAPGIVVPRIAMPEIRSIGAPADLSDGLLSDVARTCAGILSAAGPFAVLALLNSRTRFRFTGLYRVDASLLVNLYLYDRENPTLNLSGDVCRLDETYCAIVCDENRPFETPDAPKDGRLVSHVARERVLSYCGVPIRRDSGVIGGTLCHYDVRPRLLPCAEADVLELVASLLASHESLAPR